MKKRMQKLSVLLALPLTISTMSNTVYASAMNEDIVTEVSETEKNNNTLDGIEGSDITAPNGVQESDFREEKYVQKDKINDNEEEISVSETEENSDILDEKEDSDVTMPNESQEPDLGEQKVTQKDKSNDNEEKNSVSEIERNPDTTISNKVSESVYEESEKEIDVISNSLELNILTQPSDYVGQAGDTATFKIEATGDELSYKWQYSDDGKKWYTSTNTTSTYATVLTNDRNGRQIRCIVTDGNGKSIISETVTMSLGTKLEITKQPESYKGQVGDTATFKVEATGDELSYKWQYSDNGGLTWHDDSTNSKVYETTLTDSNNGRLIRCILADAYGNTLTTNEVSLNIFQAKILSHPENYEGIENDKVTFRVMAEGPGLAYRWQLSDNNGKTWYYSSITANSYTTTLTSSSNGRYVRCIVTDENGHSVTSEIATMTISENFSTGFIYRNGEWRYRYKDGSYANGLTEIEGELYYFVSTVRKTGFYKINDKRYYFDEKTGAAITGLKYVESNGFYYYFQGADDVYKGLLETEEGVRYFDTSNGVMQTGQQTVDGTTYYFALDTGLAVKGFITDPNGFTFYYDGANGIVSGWQLIEGNKYYFNSKSNELTYGLAKINGIRYYFDPETGILSNGGLINIGKSSLKIYINENGIAEKGFITVDENLYYFSETTCLSLTGLQRIGSDTYYFNDEGVAQTGFIEIDNHTYYFGSDYKMATGVQQIDNKLYYFLENGYMMTGFIRTEDGMAYYFDEETGAAIDGWYTSSSGYTYYFDPSTYEAVSDWQTIGGKRYYFNPNGVLQTGLIRDNNNKAYYYSEDGSVITGWLDKDGYRYYFDPITQAALTGVQNIDDKIYGFDSNGVMRTGYQNINGTLYYFNTTSGEAMTGFIPFFSSTGTCMVYGDPVSKTLLTGFQTIDGKCYNFRDDGTMRTGMFESNDITYYFDPVTGVAYNGFVLNGNSIFYFLKDGSAVKGRQLIDGNTYVFTSGGTRQTGLAEVDGTRYFLDSNTGISLTGPVKNGANGYYYAMKEGGGAESETFDYWGTTYYANAGGILRTNSTATVDGQIYYFDEDGERQYGLITYTNSSGTTYTFYFGETSNVTSPSKVEAIQKEMESALSQEGWHEIEGLTYYVENGNFVSGIVNIAGELYGFSETSNVLLSGMHNIGGNYYYLNEQGKVQTGFITDDNTTRYFDPDTGVMAIGFKKINGELYYFLENGAMAKGMFCIEGNIYSASTETNALLTSDGSYNSEGILENDCWKNIDNKTYYIDSYGKRVTGLQRIGETFYLFSDDGELLTGFIETNGEKRYYGEDGMVTGWQEINGYTYYFNTKSGYMETGLLPLDSGVYYLGSDGKKQTGFIDYNGSTYYFAPNTGERKYGLQTIDEKTYYFNESNGIMETGRQAINGKTYYFDTETGERLLGFVNDGVQTVYYDDSELGYAVGLQKIDNNTYLFSESNGEMLTGYRYYNDTMYYFNPQTGASISIIYEIPSGDRYYIKEGGGIYYGLQEIDGKKYYFWPTSGKEVVGLQSIGDKLYYFDKEQGMLKDTTVVVGGLTYILDSNGVASIKDDSKVAQMIRTGMEYLGQPYKEELEDGDMLSCSGYVRLMYNSVGYDNIGDSCFQQWWNATHNSNYTIIESLDEARAGDLLFYVNLNCTYGEECGFWNEIHHVGIYLGEGKTIEAASYSSEEHPELDCMMVDDVSVDGDIMLYAIVRAVN